MLLSCISATISFSISSSFLVVATGLKTISGVKKSPGSF